ncbi:erythromycin esterase family protein [Pseudonocardia sp. CA-142604]|uniref:dienelactone hydrolase family protein n=1 Tax=Pseudonocardia sp. CA-142604 TaxID=3240024 RepID=UPI003D8C664B
MRPALSGSVEELFHQVGQKEFMLSFPKSTRAAEVLHSARLERAIGAIYRPETEHQSHYFRARLADQFDEPTPSRSDAYTTSQRSPHRASRKITFSVFAAAHRREDTMSVPRAIHQSLVPVAGVLLEADLGVPRESTRGAVLFAHGSGSGRHSSRNRYVADELNRASLVTVLADLLPREEEQFNLRTTALRFDIDLLARRVTGLTDWVADSPTAGLGTGLFGASTGAAAALIAAANRPNTVQAVVSRGGRLDLADAHLPKAGQRTLLIVVERHPVVIDLNRKVAQKVGGEIRLEIIPSATHLFEEPGTLEQVAHLARDRFLRPLRALPHGENDG